MVIVPVGCRAAYTVLWRLNLIWYHCDDTSPVATITLGCVNLALDRYDAAYLTDEEVAGVCSLTAVLHLHPACINEQRLILLGKGRTQCATYLTLRFWATQHKVCEFGILTQVILDNLIFGEQIQLLTQDSLCLSRTLALSHQVVDVVLEEIFHTGKAAISTSAGI